MRFNWGMCPNLHPYPVKEKRIQGLDAEGNDTQLAFLCNSGVSVVSASIFYQYSMAKPVYVKCPQEPKVEMVSFHHTFPGMT